MLKNKRAIKLKYPDRPLFEPRYENVVEMFWDAVEVCGDQPAMIEGERSLTYREFGWCVASLANLLIEAGAQGSRVGMCVPNSIESNIAVYAILAAGAQVVLLNPLYTPAELGPLLKDAQPEVMIFAEGGNKGFKALGKDVNSIATIIFGQGKCSFDALCDAGAKPPSVRIGPESKATLHFTGGTTGLPKSLDRDHRGLMQCVHAMHWGWPTSIGEEVWLNVAPITHIWGFAMGCMNPVYDQSSLVIIPRYNPEVVLGLLERHKVTVFSGGPSAIYAGLLAVPYIDSADLDDLRVCPGGGSTFLQETHRSWERVTATPIIEAYGMTEAGPIAINPLNGGHRYGTVGYVYPDIELEIVSAIDPERPVPIGESGEIRLRGPRVINTYRNNDESRADGWLYTGDVGRLDEDGFLTLVDRKKNMLIVGGFNVYPREIEELLVTHSGIVEAAVIGIPDERKGERPVACVVPLSDVSLTVEEILEFCAENLVDYKRPIAVYFLGSIPKTSANKVCNKTLSQIISNWPEESGYRE